MPPDVYVVVAYPGGTPGVSVRKAVLGPASDGDVSLEFAAEAAVMTASEAEVITELVDEDVVAAASDVEISIELVVAELVVGALVVVTPGRGVPFCSGAYAPLGKIGWLPGKPVNGPCLEGSRALESAISSQILEVKTLRGTLGINRQYVRTETKLRGYKDEIEGVE